MAAYGVKPPYSRPFEGLSCPSRHPRRAFRRRHATACLDAFATMINSRAAPVLANDTSFWVLNETRRRTARWLDLAGQLKTGHHEATQAMAVGSALRGKTGAGVSSTRGPHSRGGCTSVRWRRLAADARSWAPEVLPSLEPTKVGNRHDKI